MRLITLAPVEQTHNMGVYGMVFGGGESIFAVKLAKFCSLDDTSIFVKVEK